MDKKVVFIMGAGHCGSTLLDLLLGSHSQSFSLGELYRMGSLVDGRSEGHENICGVCVGECEFWNKRVPRSFLKMYFGRENRFQAALGKLSQHIYNPYKLIARWSAKSILIDSSKGSAWIERRLRPSYTWHGIEPYLIYMCRDGRAVVNSYYRKYPERGITNVIQKWKQQTDTMNAFFSQFSHQKIRVQYEELAMYPERVVRALCKFLDVEYERAMLRYWTHEHHHVMGNGGTRSLIFKYREKLGMDDEALRNRQDQAKRFYDSSYYDGMELGIRLDERWRLELSPEHCERFDMLAGETNKSLDYGRDERLHHD